jgi:hypothetical protein
VTADAHSSTSTADYAGVIAWRRRRLLEVGFDGMTADVFARTTSVDLHELIQLVERGCPPELAVRIMAPLDVTEIAS